MSTSEHVVAAGEQSPEVLYSQGVSRITPRDDTARTIDLTTHRTMWELAEVLSAHGGQAQVEASRRIWASLSDR